MKKIFVLAIVLMFATTVSSFAAPDKAPDAADAGLSLYGAITGTAAKTDTLLGKMSNGVYPGWNTNTLGYAVTTQHISGSKSYGTAHDSTAIYRNDSAPQTPSDPDNESFGAADSWTAM